MIDTSNSMLYRLDVLNEKQTRISYQMSSGKVLDEGSDDTVVYTRDLYINDKMRTYDGLKTQLEKNNAQNDVSDSTLAEVKNLLDFIKTETIKARNDTNDDVSRKAIAVQIEGAKDNLFTLVNEKVEEEYIFSGSQTNVEAFVKDSEGKITYNGNPNLRTAAVETDSYRERGVTGFDIMSFDVKSAESGDFLTFDERERIVDENGREWKLNSTESVLVEYDEDGKATKNFVPVTMTIDEETSKKSYEIDELPTGIDDETKTFTVKHNTFDTIDDIISGLKSNDGNAISLGLEDINSAYNAANQAHGELGARNNTFEIAYDRVSSKLTHFNVLSIENSSADLTKVAIEAKQLEITYTSLYSTISKMNSLSLVNFVS